MEKFVKHAHAKYGDDADPVGQRFCMRLSKTLLFSTAGTTLYL